MLKLDVNAPCTVNGSRDLYFEFEARPFIGQPCVFLGLAKSGLARVALASNRKMQYSVPQRNVDPLDVQAHPPTQSLPL